jgi:hypothetical protein
VYVVTVAEELHGTTMIDSSSSQMFEVVRARGLRTPAEIPTRNQPPL